ncbi:PREDICTED: cytochrome P450 4C1-like [Vollenhovia emeryi]|uniref:cytochrome P450 4C1-like n=1 Tax=Vollenhovia emeryi TaxID=411798 RepID=UPI0005F572EF|nr:PREDICTED: cytochrome P450 4C1-like [Vollenhovia emeryi]XP_011871728.1 PREDICTED: cytochrome P450 4C1-like [Vollenhovia emeryi]XP_011871729.1 PREDICTED: cytochrome P450 4C1-like [Vollenhovia emeryi]XP_011871730.1 PREDICTED: cytochrome P450 4C1-like [Vollenhovia emeryi]XP_011871731.1 PREDICTED: cytochrome P450 4C1-like [Vollenhovia emeryi]XP_011871732.1 PREDICTED: cytochrome P450 4C1-like [Vollenhovia emeryi]XP_011871733.1 PREDICTED: cytochrome P450 4C1-like [Vollenhovia emeryi]
MDFISLALWTLCIVLILKILPTVRRKYVIRQKLKDFPKVGGLPFFGKMFEIINKPEHERMKVMVSFMEKFKEGIFVDWIVTKPFITVFKPEYLEHIFPSTVNITKADMYDLFKPWLGNGLVTSTGQKWFHDRRLIGPTFHFSILDQFAVVLSEKAEILTKCFQREIEKNSREAVDVFPFVISAALDIICETAMGVNMHAQETKTQYTSAAHKASRLIVDRSMRPWYWIDWLYYRLPAGKEFKSALNTLHEFTKGVIDQKKAERRSQNHTELENEDDESNIGKKKRKAFLDLLLDQNEKADTPLTDDELRAQVDTFMFAGHDTTAVAITWTLFLLGDNLEHQEKVHEELEEVFGDSEEPASVKELSQLKCLDRVIKETLRIFPSVPFVSRELTEEVKLDKYTIPKGVLVTMPIYLIHRNSEVWPNPTKFDPDRFLPENSKNRNPYAYVPFSAGPRNCIGQRFALLEEKIVLTAILRKWRVKSMKTLDTIKYAGVLILRPCEEVHVHFTPKK